MTPDKARKMAEEIANRVVPSVDRSKAADIITQAILQFAQERESEAVKVLMRLHSDSTASDFNEHWESYTDAAALIAKHSKERSEVR